MASALLLIDTNSFGTRICGLIWWRRRGLNSRPLGCEPNALPAELRPHLFLTRNSIAQMDGKSKREKGNFFETEKHEDYSEELLFFCRVFEGECLI